MSPLKELNIFSIAAKYIPSSIKTSTHFSEGSAHNAAFVFTSIFHFFYVSLFVLPPSFCRISSPLIISSPCIYTSSSQLDVVYAHVNQSCVERMISAPQWLTCITIQKTHTLMSWSHTHTAWESCISRLFAVLSFLLWCCWISREQGPFTSLTLHFFSICFKHSHIMLLHQDTRKYRVITVKLSRLASPPPPRFFIFVFILLTSSPPYQRIMRQGSRQNGTPVVMAHLLFNQRLHGDAALQPFMSSHRLVSLSPSLDASFLKVAFI